MMRRGLCFGTMTALATVAAHGTGDAAAQVVQTQEAASLPSRIDSLVTAEMEANHVAGLSLAVVHGTDTLAFRGYGWANMEHDVPASPTTVYPIASVTKPMTAAAVLTLVDQGRLTLDTPVRPLLAHLPDAGPTIRTRHLLNHTSGLPDYYSQPGWVQIRDLRPDLDRARELITALVSDEPLLFPPGEGRRYSNAGYDYLGDLLAAVTDTAYGDWVGARLFDPLGLTRTGLCSWRDVVPERAAGYEPSEEGWRHASVIAQEFAYASGGLCSTVGELVAWSHALHGGRVLSPATYASMTTPEGASTAYGFGIETGDLEGHAFFKHNGSLPGFAAQLDHYPDDDLVIAVLANSPAAVGGLADAIARAALDLPPVAQPTAPDGWRVATAPPGDPGDIFFRTMGPGVHTTAGPAALYFHPDSLGTDPYAVEATFVQIARPEPDEGHGLVLAGRDLDSATPAHLDFLVRGDGSWGVRRRQGDRETWVRSWTPSDAVNPKAPTGTASNALAVEVSGGEATFRINDQVVTTIQAESATGLNGVAGLWVGPGHDMHVAGFAVRE